MINKVSNITFTGYKQQFTDEEFQLELNNSTQWAKDNIDNRTYLLPKKLMDKKLEKESGNGLSILKNFRNIFKSHEIEPILELSIEEHELVGKLSHYNVKPVEIRTQMPRNIKTFFKTLLDIAKSQIEVDKLERTIWTIVQNEKYIKALQEKRYKEIMKEGLELPRTIALMFDPEYARLTDKLATLFEEKQKTLELLEPFKKKLVNTTFSIKLK